MGAILWLASYPKSGNTWLRAFLANYLRNTQTPVDINDLAKFAPNEASRSYFERAYGGSVTGLGETEIHRLRPKVHRLLAGAIDHTAFLKTHLALTRIDGVATITPEVTAGAIYIVRNPLDVAASFMAFYNAPAEEVVAAMNFHGTCLPGSDTQVYQHLGTWRDHVTGWARAPGLRRLVLRYEDMARQPETTFDRAIRFLALPADAARLRRAIRFSRFEALSRQEKAHGFVERPGKGAPFFRSGKLGGYRRSLTTDQIRRLIEGHREVMQEYGYLAPDGHPRY